jgi:hypothetical protein
MDYPSQKEKFQTWMKLWIKFALRLQTQILSLWIPTTLSSNILSSSSKRIFTKLKFETDISIKGIFSTNGGPPALPHIELKSHELPSNILIIWLQSLPIPEAVETKPFLVV